MEGGEREGGREGEREKRERERERERERKRERGEGLDVVSWWLQIVFLFPIQL